MEREAYLKKSNNTAVARRLEDAASAIQWLVERSLLRFNRKVIKTLFSHILQTIVNKGELLSLVSLLYGKTLRAVISHDAHVEHMSVEEWMRIFYISFAVVLGENLDKAMENANKKLAHKPATSDADLA